MTEITAPARPRRLRSDGERSRRAILDAAAKLATTEGIDGLSIGRLAEHIGMSKSGLYAHFGSKVELQLATVDTATAIFEAEVLEPASRAPEGVARLEALCEGFLSHVERKVFPGGCFFAAVSAELDTHPGPVHDRITAVHRHWLDLLDRLVRDAQERGELDASTEPAQLVFELESFMLAANAFVVLYDDPAVFSPARAAIAARLR
jgi:AcrR family transcriptional regulator